MKVPKIVIAVAALHVVPIALVLQSGCQSGTDKKNEVVQARTAGKTTVPASDQPGLMEGDPAFNSGLPPEGKLPIAEDTTLREVPTRPSDVVDGSLPPLEPNEALRKQTLPETVAEARMGDREEKKVVDAGRSLTASNAYIIQKGDSLWSIAQKNGLSVDALLAANGLKKNARLQPGSQISIPSGSVLKSKSSEAISSVEAKRPATSSEKQDTSGATEKYVVLPGDSLATIAKKFGTTPRSIQSLNGINDPKKLRAGQQIVVRSKTDSSDGESSPVVNFAKATSVVKSSPVATATKSTASSSSATAVRTGEGTYQVQKGDTLGSIAKKNGLGIKDLMDMNKITNPRALQVGQRLIVKRSGAGSTGATSLQRQPDARPVNTARLVAKPSVETGTPSAGQATTGVPVGKSNFDSFDDVPVVGEKPEKVE